MLRSRFVGRVGAPGGCLRLAPLFAGRVFVWAPFLSGARFDVRFSRQKARANYRSASPLPLSILEFSHSTGAALVELHRALKPLVCSPRQNRCTLVNQHKHETARDVRAREADALM